MGTVIFKALLSDQSVAAQVRTTGPAGATFTPHVDESGELSWTNNRGLANPETVNIKGPKGDKGEKGDKGDLAEVPMHDVNAAITSTAEALQTAYANIFSGRNLLRNTNKGLSGWRFVTKNDAVYALGADGEGVKLSLTTAPTLYGVLVFSVGDAAFKLKPTANYVLSFDLTCNTSSYFECRLSKEDGSMLLAEKAYIYPVGNEAVEHIELLLTTNDLTGVSKDHLVYFYLPKESGKYWIIKNLKLERGSTSTPWVSAPEDTVSAIPGLTEKTANAFDVAEEFVLANKPVAKVKTVTLRAANWVGTASPYSQVVTIEGTTEHSKVDLTPTVEQMATFHQKDIAFVTENEDGVITVYVIGDKPTNDYTMPVTITEVLV